MFKVSQHMYVKIQSNLKDTNKFHIEKGSVLSSYL
jgi:hypothetical protein